MGILIGIDFGLKRSGIAVSDPMKIIASPLTTIETSQLIIFLDDYIPKEKVEKIILGKPLNLKGEMNPLEKDIQKFITILTKNHPNIEIIRIDERFTSSISKDIMLASGIGKMKRRDKSLLDKISASIILESYLGSLK